MSNPVSVKSFYSTMTGAPRLTGEAGKLIGVLDTCLINGFGSVTLDSVVIADGVATATDNSGHGFVDYAVVLIEGATPAGVNGEKRIAVTSSTASSTQPTVTVRVGLTSSIRPSATPSRAAWDRVSPK